MEDLQIIKVLSKNSSQEKLSDKFRGSLNLTDQEYNDIQHQLTGMHNEQVAADRQGVTDVFTNEKVKVLIKEKGIQLIGFKDLVQSKKKYFSYAD